MAKHKNGNLPIAEASPMALVESLIDFGDMPVINPVGFVVSQPIGSPFIFFAHPLSTQAWAMLTKIIPQPKQNYPYLITQEDAEPLEPLRLTPLKVYQCWCTENGQGRATAFRNEPPTENRNDWKEYVESICIVYAKEGAILARGTFKGPKAQGWQLVMNCLEQMKADANQWYSISANHKLTEGIAQPELRMVIEMGVRERTSKTNGMTYTYTTSRIEPMSANYFTQLQKLFNSESFKEDLQNCKDGLSRRITELQNAKP